MTAGNASAGAQWEKVEVNKDINKNICKIALSLNPSVMEIVKAWKRI